MKRDILGGTITLIALAGMAAAYLTPGDHAALFLICALVAFMASVVPAFTAAR